MIIPMMYEIPLFLFIGAGVFVVYQFFYLRNQLVDGELKRSHIWLILSASSFSLWALIHIYFDLFPSSPDTQLFTHYIISHLFALTSMICLGVYAKKTRNIYSSIISKKNKNK